MGGMSAPAELLILVSAVGQADTSYLPPLNDNPPNFHILPTKVVQVSTKKEPEGKIFGSEWRWRGVQILHPALICKAAARERDFVTTCHLCLVLYICHTQWRV